MGGGIAILCMGGKAYVLQDLAFVNNNKFGTSKLILAGVYVLLSAILIIICPV